MGQVVCGGAMLKCSFGVAPSSLMVLPANIVTTAMPIANIMDNKPMMNILPLWHVSIHGQSYGSCGDSGGIRRSNSHALYSCYCCTWGTRLPYRSSRQYACVKQ